MKPKEIFKITYKLLLILPRSKLIKAFATLRTKYKELEKKYQKLQNENQKLKEELKKLTIKQINKEVNQPSSKLPEWEVKGVGNDGKGKKRGRGRKGRKGAGNKKKTKPVTRNEKARLEDCPKCGKDLRKIRPLKDSNVRIIEDIVEPQEAEVIEVKQEKKYCSACKQVVTARTELALSKSDIGLNSTLAICYLWIESCLPYTRIAKYLKEFFGLGITTTGLSEHVIRVSSIMDAVYQEILSDVNKAYTLFADETGWRIKAKNWWLWVFGTKESAYFVIDKSRGSDVVRQVLGEIFLGVLVVDGWRAYLSIICQQQSCMAHLLRKIRKFYASFPHLKDISKFYVKLRRIIKDGERLQSERKRIGEEVFCRRLKKLKTRLQELLEWPNPDEILEEVIKKVYNQQSRILTFVEYPGVPCHNNFAEYLIRIGVLKRKISGGSKSYKGAKAYAVLLSIYTTCKLRGIPFRKFLRESLIHYTKTGKPMLLKQYMGINSIAKAA